MPGRANGGDNGGANGGDNGNVTAWARLFLDILADIPQVTLKLTPTVVSFQGH